MNTGIRYTHARNAHITLLKKMGVKIDWDKVNAKSEKSLVRANKKIREKLGLPAHHARGRMSDNLSNTATFWE